MKANDRVILPNGVSAGTVKRVRSTTVDVLTDRGQLGSYYFAELRVIPREGVALSREKS